MATTQRLMTAEELARLPNDGWRYELIEGELRRMAPAGGEHGEISSEAARQLGNHVIPRSLGRIYGADTGFFVTGVLDTVVAPDVAFVRTECLPPRRDRRGYMPVIPDLVVEVVSPTDVRMSRRRSHAISPRLGRLAGSAPRRGPCDRAGAAGGA